MKKLLFILLTIPLNLLSQEFPGIDTLNFGRNVKEAFLYTHFIDKKDSVLVEKYVFDSNGNHAYTFFGYSYPYQSRTQFEYSNGQLIKIVDHQYQSAFNKSINNEMYEKYFEILSKGENSENERKADSLYHAYQLKYELIDPHIVEWEKKGKLSRIIEIEYKSKNKPKTFKLLESRFNESPVLDLVVEFEYFNNGSIKSKTWIDINNSDELSVNAFKPNSYDLEDSIRVISGDIRKKVFEYQENLVSIQYFLNDALTGFEEQIYYPELQEKCYKVMNLAGDTLSYYKELYDIKNRIIKWNRIIFTGYDGFGYTHDCAVGNEKRFFYSENGTISKIVVYENEEEYSISTYVY